MINIINIFQDLLIRYIIVTLIIYIVLDILLFTGRMSAFLFSYVTGWGAFGQIVSQLGLTMVDLIKMTIYGAILAGFARQYNECLEKTKSL